MQGQSEALSDSAPVPGAYEYRFLEDVLIPLQNPVGEDIRTDRTAGERFREGIDTEEWLATHLTGGACYGHTNLVPAFCKAYREETGRDALAVHVAKGSTLVSQWLPGTPGYEIIRDKSLAARRKLGEKAGRCFFVWLQGESDAIRGCPKKEYKELLAHLGRQLKRDLGIEKIGVIRVGRFTMDDRDWEIIHAQDEICRENPDFLMLTGIATVLNEQKEAMHPGVFGHYSAWGLQKLGEAAGAALGNYVRETV